MVQQTKLPCSHRNLHGKNKSFSPSIYVCELYVMYVY